MKSKHFPVLPLPSLIPLLKSNHYEQFLVYPSKKNVMHLVVRVADLFLSESYSDCLDSKWHDSFRPVSDCGHQDSQTLSEAGG